MSRNGGYDRYRAALADESAWARARRPKCCKLANSPRLRQAVAGKLRLDSSPEQIAGWLKRTHPEDECNQVSHESIYRSLFVQTRGVLKKELLSHLRSKRSMRRSTASRTVALSRCQMVSRMFIARKSTSPAARYRLPAIYPYQHFFDVGGLMYYGPEMVDQYRRAASYIDRIIKGENPAELPVQAPTKNWPSTLRPPSSAAT